MRCDSSSVQARTRQLSSNSTMHSASIRKRSDSTGAGSAVRLNQRKAERRLSKTRTSDGCSGQFYECLPHSSHSEDVRGGRHESTLGDAGECHSSCQNSHIAGGHVKAGNRTHVHDLIEVRTEAGISPHVILTLLHLAEVQRVPSGADYQTQVAMDGISGGNWREPALIKMEPNTIAHCGNAVVDRHQCRWI